MRTKITILILIVSRYILPYGEIPSAKIESVTMMGMFCMFTTDCYDTDTQNHNYTPKYWWDFDYNGSQFTTDEYSTYSTIGHTFTEEREYTVALIYTDDDGVSSLIATTYIDLRPMQTCYYLKDHLGNIKMTVNEQGEVIGYDDYYPFGMIMAGRSMNTGNPDDLYKYTGKERDKESGYDYFGARFYDSRIGRWLQVDPLAEKYLNWSPYNYTLNNPLKFVDPNGKFPGNIHARVISNARGYNWFQRSLEYANQYVIKDVINMFNQSMHLDNLNPGEVLPMINKQGGFLNMDDHTIGDFYSHSNYIDLWNDFKNANTDKKLGDMPLMSELDLESEFGVKVKEQLKTTQWPKSDGDYPHNVENAKDTDKNKYHNQAVDAYQRELNKKYDYK